MFRQPTTRLQVSGHRFLVRRMEHALVCGDTRMVHDPMRAQSLSFVTGCMLAVVIVGVCAVLALLRPGVTLGDSAIVIARDSGALYVRVDDTFHPVPNLASARLIAGSAATPSVVSAAEIAKARRGPSLGIPGAPAVIGKPLADSESAWTICDRTTTTVVVGQPQPPDDVGRQPSILVTPRSESAAATYLLYDGRRAQVDLRNPAVVWALRLDGVVPRPVSRAVLDAIPEAPAITVPPLQGAGRPSAIGGLPVGTVVRVTGTGADEYFVVLSDGVQRIGEVAANLLRLIDSHGRREIVAVSPDVIGTARVVETLPVSTFPVRAGTTAGADDNRFLCAQWQPGPRTVLRMVDSLPVDSTRIELVQADDDGVNVDNVMMPTGRSAFVRSAALMGDGGDAAPLYLLTDSGVLFGLGDDDTAKLLGLDSEPVAAPWVLLSRLPRGPELSRAGALIARDVVAPPP